MRLATSKPTGLPALRGKNAPYFSYQFFQTDQVNQLFPMQVTPSHDTVFRMFMDYAELQSQPQQLPQPAATTKIASLWFYLSWVGRVETVACRLA